MIDRFKPIAVALLLATAPASADTASEEINTVLRERAKLWNDCNPMDLLVEDLTNDSTDIGLTREAIEIAVRSRLRAARLYAADVEAVRPYLYVRLTVVGRAFSIDVSYKKVLLDEITGLRLYATTWDSLTIGTHGPAANYILQSVAQRIDKFIDEYLRVNSDACGPPSSVNDQ